MKEIRFDQGMFMDGGIFFSKTGEADREIRKYFESEDEFRQFTDNILRLSMNELHNINERKRFWETSDAYGKAMGKYLRLIIDWKLRIQQYSKFVDEWLLSLL